MGMQTRRLRKVQARTMALSSNIRSTMASTLTDTSIPTTASHHAPIISKISDTHWVNPDPRALRRNSPMPSSTTFRGQMPMHPRKVKLQQTFYFLLKVKSKTGDALLDKFRLRTSTI